MVMETDLDLLGLGEVPFPENAWGVPWIAFGLMDDDWMDI